MREAERAGTTKKRGGKEKMSEQKGKKTEGTGAEITSGEEKNLGVEMKATKRNRRVSTSLPVTC